MAKNNLEKIYNDYYDMCFREVTLPRKDSKITQIMTLVGSNKRVLDIGCSSGYLGHFLERQNNIVVGLDFVKSAVLAGIKNNLDCRYCNIENDELPLKEGEIFDVIILSEILEHFIDPLPIIKKLQTVLKDNGILIISTPNIAYIQYRAELFFGFLPDFCEFRDIFFERPYNFQHKTLFTYKVLENTLSMAGLKVLKKTSHTAYKNHFERFFNFLASLFPGLFVKNMIFVCAKNKS
jgi:2-polyprenyl-3-methyl-5-hydroxy-6-metoxy-1,4-benzoquinol methylase